MGKAVTFALRNRRKAGVLLKGWLRVKKGACEYAGADLTRRGSYELFTKIVCRY
jgi:hypothetical protein